MQAIFGGTFDPIHYGHLLPLKYLAKKLKLKKIILIPNKIPPHKPMPIANSQQRLKMIQLAIKKNPLFSIDTRELKKNATSFIIKTLNSYRKEIGWNKPLALIIGEDSLSSLNKWFKWKEILKTCHLLVCKRKTKNINKSNFKYKFKKTKNLKTLYHEPYGLIYIAKTPLINISSKEIRQNKINLKINLPKEVFNYIKKENIY